MDVKKAMNIFKKKFPDLTITTCIDYDDEHYVVEALKDVNKSDHNDPFYAIDKESGNITGFIPSLDIDAFLYAVENRTVFSMRGKGDNYAN